jgi:hypothetical protein
MQREPCKSWLASEEAGKPDINVAWRAAFAGKPAPTGNLGEVHPRAGAGQRKRAIKIYANKE